jgi:hypothetical protein
MHGERVILGRANKWDPNAIIGEALAASQMAPSVNMYDLEYTVAGPESIETRKVLECRPWAWTSERELTEEELAHEEEKKPKHIGIDYRQVLAEVEASNKPGARSSSRQALQEAKKEDMKAAQTLQEVVIEPPEDEPVKKVKSWDPHGFTDGINIA